MSDIPPKDAPLPDTLKLRNGWIASLLMTGLCIAFVLISIGYVIAGKGMLAIFAIVVFIPGIWLGIEHIRTEGSYILLEPHQFTRGVYGHVRTWSWKEVSSFRAETYKGKKGIWCRLDKGDTGDDILIESGSRNPEELADLLNRFRQRAIGERFTSL
ncbi:hypothetical protein [Hirschia baltica]|uniref:Integral membrane protein-like protein n=1 Tax=Hirschia baltica (strain ATCC 49814 / DSM 5838 / IFAM 1418) TaxID=582402 RepID=C6XK53_HIRBI|nr:hypothetical protein [Hirschia baltica]ACT59498.1 hypothetical protein Hbal_1812 [Hirschia baltica ATCC 49814]